MVYSPMQFQRGLSLVKFIERYDTGDQFGMALFKARWPTGFECLSCGCRIHCSLVERKLYQSNTCLQQTSVTVGRSSTTPISRSRSGS